MSVVVFTAAGFIVAAWIASGVSFVLSSLKVCCILLAALNHFRRVSPISASACVQPPYDVDLMPHLLNSTALAVGPSDIVASYAAPDPFHFLAGNAILFVGEHFGRWALWTLI